MKKTLLFVCALMLSTLAWAGYGIIVNDCQYYVGVLNPSPQDQSFTEYTAHVNIQSGDYCQLYDDGNQAKWAVPLDEFSKPGFTRDNDRYICTVTGCYDFYIKLKYQEDQLYIGDGSNCGEPENVCPTTGFCISGNGTPENNWCCGLEWDSAACPLGEYNTITFKDVPAGKYQFKITNGTWARSWGGNFVDATASTQGYATDAYGNAAFTLSANADITVSFDGKKIVLTSTQPFVPTWTGAVPSQCHDVLMQGFYYDSYTVNDSAGNGTDIYGDTRWNTLDAQVGEIGSYFDLIWLPPSALASGTGYHPRQFSNQNSDWGSRAELQSLINHFHQAGAKVVADIVINHIEAMEGWCHISTQNFGEYGVYVPDPTYICSNDEVNWPDGKEGRNWATEAGECSGYAQGKEDDGANWKDARDWAHSEVKVQEMFKAYMKWMRNVIGYDGWRYDKGDGFHNWHMWNYNQASEPCIAFMECWSGNSEISSRIHNSNYDVMGLDFQSKYKAFDGISQFNYSMCQINNSEEQKPWDNRGLIGCGWNPASNSKWSKYAVTFIDSHDWFYRANGQEFGANGDTAKAMNGISMTPAMKDRLLQACAYQMSVPGVPCVFYPHWKKYKADIKPMINARRVAGVHSESDVTDEEVSNSGYKATVHGTNGLLIITLGDKTIQEATGNNKWLADYGYVKMASGPGYAMWVQYNDDVAARLVCTPDCEFQDSINGIKVGISAVGGSGNAVIYYTLDGSEPTTESPVYTDSLTVTESMVLKAMAVVNNAKSQVYTYNYTYREPLKRGIQVRFDKPEEWEKVYYYAWIPEVDSVGKIVGSTNVMGAYPGQRIYQDMDGWYNYEFPLSMDTVNFCISSGDDCGELNVRSNDLKIGYDTYYKWEDDFEEEDKHELVVDEPYEIPMEFAVQISPESGEFRDSIIGEMVKITVLGKKGALIYYTTDGSDPSLCANPAVDTVTFYVKESATIQAYAYDVENQTTTETKKIELIYKDPQEGPLQVRFIKPHDWSDLGLYAFTRIKRAGQKDKDIEQCLDGKSGKWPGMRWTTFETINGGQDSVYYFTLKDEWKEIYVIFNNYTTDDAKKVQTQDIYLAENTCYVWNVDCRKAVVSPNCDGKEPMGIEDVLNADRVSDNAKFMLDGELYIRVGDTIYDIYGRKMK